jgi:hypothetical protein
MKLFIIERDNTSYDEAIGFLIQANSEMQARNMLQVERVLKPGGEGREFWLKGGTCKRIGANHSRQSKVLMRSFHYA